MRYVLLVYSNPRNWGHPTFLRTPEALDMPEARRAEMAEGFEALMRELRESGELVSVAALADPVTVRTVRVRGGRPVATDGPFVESKEQMAGLFVLECGSPERAEEIAARFPDARFGAIELRPVMDIGGDVRVRRGGSAAAAVAPVGGEPHADGPDGDEEQHGADEGLEHGCNVT